MYLPCLCKPKQTLHSSRLRSPPHRATPSHFRFIENDAVIKLNTATSNKCIINGSVLQLHMPHKATENVM